MSIVLACCSASVFGDLLVLGITAVSAQKRRTSDPVKMLCFFALADLVTMILQLPGQAQSLELCKLQATAIWAMTWSSWLWTMGYAHVVHGAFHRAAHSGLSNSPRHGLGLGTLHLLCWGFPLLLAGFGYAFGLFGRSEFFSTSDQFYCDFVMLGWNTAAQSVCVVAILYNFYTFAIVHLFVRTSLSSNLHDLPPEQQEAAYLRLRLWPRFLLYSASFIVTQLPDLTLDALEALALVQATTGWDAATDAIAQLHGLLNALVFCCTNARGFLWQHTPPCCRSTCCSAATVGPTEAARSSTAACSGPLLAEAAGAHAMCGAASPEPPEPPSPPRTGERARRRDPRSTPGLGW